MDLVDQLPESPFKLYKRLLGPGKALKNTKTLFLLQIVMGARRPLLADELRHALTFSEVFGHSKNTNIGEWESPNEGSKSGDEFASYV